MFRFRGGKSLVCCWTHGASLSTGHSIRQATQDTHQYTPNLGFINNSRHYHKLMIDLRSYLYNNWLTASSLALRINGENLWGKFPLHEAAFLGGQRNLRGFPRERFAGDALVFGSIELRSYLLPLKIIFPGRVGLSAFAETGRVFYAGEKSSVWHPSFGGGIWISFLNRLFTAHVTGAKSNEDLQIYLTTGYMF